MRKKMRSRQMAVFALSFSMILAEGAVAANASIKSLSDKYDSSPVYTNQGAQTALSKEEETNRAHDCIEVSEEGRNTDSKNKRLSADELNAIHEQQMASFDNMLSNMLNSQIGMSNIAEGTNILITKDLFSKLNITPADSAKAAQAISEDGEWGVKAFAVRIMDMAVALSGGDVEKLSVIRGVVEEGFSDAEKQWGGKLPSVAQDTHAEINSRFDYWEKHGTLDGYVMEEPLG